LEGHDELLCRQLADIVAKVENPSAPKIWRKLILGYLRGCVTFQRHWEGPWLILDETIWSPTQNASAALRIFVRHPKKTFATISATSFHSLTGGNSFSVHNA